MKDSNWFRHSYSESPKSVGMSAKLAMEPREFATHKKTHEFGKRNDHLRCNIQKAFGLSKNEFCLKMIIGCDLSMTDFITS